MNANALPIIAIIGPTASGKTQLAVELAAQIDAEIISVDARQVYKHLNIGTGKDLASYHINGRSIPYHLIDIVEPTERYHIYQFQKDFFNAVQDIWSRGKRVIACGGTGLYLEAVIGPFEYTSVPINTSLRADLAHLDLTSLNQNFHQIPELLNVEYSPDLSTKKRSIRAIEIKTFLQNNGIPNNNFPKIDFQVFATTLPSEIRNQKIDLRLKARIAEGLITEVCELLANGIDPAQLEYFGLEYKFCLAHLQGKLTLPELELKLSIAIHQYAKRQMTYFRKMEKSGVNIHWLNAQESPITELLANITIHNKKIAF